MRNESRIRFPGGVAAVVAAWLMLLPTALRPSIDLSTSASGWLVRWTGTADLVGVVLIGCALVALVVTRRPLGWRRSVREACVHVVVLTLVLGGGALLNEYLLKEALAVPRPSVVALAEADALGMTAEAFYASMDKASRRIHLRELLSDSGFDAIPLSMPVRAHWADEAGYAFPSGHALAAMTIATYFLVSGAVLVSSSRRLVLFLLPLWAASIGWSRVLLGVHRSQDVVWGGLLGAALGVAAAVAAWWLLPRFPLFRR